MRYAPNVRRGFFPLDEELQLVPGQLTPSVHEQLVHLGTWMPFERARKELAFFSHVTVSEARARQQTEAAGAAYVAVQTAEVERLERETPPAPAGPERQLLSVDGAMVPLVHGEWAEVKTLTLGCVQPPIQEKGEWVVHSRELSYFSRLADAETFGRLALVETHRRGTDSAQTVCAVTDGAEWEQRFIDLHREDAVRILDFSHAAGYVAQAGQVVWGEGSETSQHWLRETLHELKHGSPQTVLNTLHDMRAEVLAREGETSRAVETLGGSVAYLEKRQAQIAYARFQAAGYPIGSGSGESANKLVVEARLKGAGMHWARPHVDPMLALRNIACSDRWAEAWPQIETQLRAQERQRRAQRRQQHQAQRAQAPTTASETASTSVTVSTNATPAKADVPVLPTTDDTPNAAPSTRAGPKQPYRPPANHPWRRFAFGRALRQVKPSSSSAKS